MQWGVGGIWNYVLRRPDPTGLIDAVQHWYVCVCVCVRACASAGHWVSLSVCASPFETKLVAFLFWVLERVEIDITSRTSLIFFNCSHRNMKVLVFACAAHYRFTPWILCVIPLCDQLMSFRWCSMLFRSECFFFPQFNLKNEICFSTPSPQDQGSGPTPSGSGFVCRMHEYLQPTSQAIISLDHTWKDKTLSFWRVCGTQ